MKAILRGLIITLFVVQYVNAQKSPIKFGVIPQEDLKMNVYSKDSSASAVILTNYGKAAMTFYSTVKLEVDRHVRIKILNKEGLKWADAQIELYHSGSNEDKVTDFKASTFNLENGKLVETPVAKSSMFKEKFNKNINIQKFTFPNVKEGSILEYSYTILSDFALSFPDWEFQEKIPTRHNEFYALIPDFCIYQKFTQGYLVPNYEVKNVSTGTLQSKLHHWTMSDAPAFKAEPYMTSEDDYLSKINFAISHLNFPGEPVYEIMGSWDKLSRDLVEDEDFGKVITGSGFLKKSVEEIIAGVTEEKQKVEKIHTYIKTNFEWDGTKDIYADNLKKVVETKKGTSADLNLMLASMLDKAGLSVEMVVLSTRDHGFIRKQYPMKKQMNYVLCRVWLGNEFLLLDATEKYLPMEMLPERCLNGEGLLVSKKSTGWVNLESRGKSKTIINAAVTLESDGVLNGNVAYLFHGYDGSASRNDYFKKGEENFFKTTDHTNAWEIRSKAFENASDISKPAIKKMEVSIPSHASVSGNQIYLNPFISGQIAENPFKSESREYPVDFGNPIETVYLGKIVIPDGYAPEELPQAKILSLPNNAGKYVYSVSVTGKQISVVSTLQINKSMFVQTEYESLRAFYSLIVAKQSEQIVLKKL